MTSKNVQVPVSEQHIALMFDRIAGRYDFLNGLLSMRQDRRWRKQLVASIPYRPAGQFVDVATGTGDVVMAAARARQEYKAFAGVDISSAMLEHAKVKARQSTLGTKIQFALMSAEKLQYANDSVDCLSISFGLRNVVDKTVALSEFQRVLNTDGVLLILEFFPPKKNFLSGMFKFYFHYVLPFIGGLFSDRSAYTYLPQSVSGFYSIEELTAKLRGLGFATITTKAFLFGSCYLIEARKS